jgi:D-sedoheptulose 7-phosphate isomerase
MSIRKIEGFNFCAYSFFNQLRPMANNRIHQHFDEALSVLQSFMSDPANLQAVSEAGEAMTAALKNGGKIISCGNGGSMSDAMHFAEELSGRYRDNRPALAALSISDPTHMSCVGNDYGYDFVFSRFVEAVGNAGDVLLAISTSGNSGNVLKAAEAAKKKGMTVVGLTGKDGGKLAPLCDVECRVPWNGYADRIQEVHIKIIHSLIDYIELNV